jgi:hypothetical protein
MFQPLYGTAECQNACKSVKWQDESQGKDLTASSVDVTVVLTHHLPRAAAENWEKPQQV